MVQVGRKVHGGGLMVWRSGGIQQMLVEGGDASAR